MNIKYIFILATVIFFSCQPSVVEKPIIKNSSEETFMLGIDNFIKNYTNMIKGKRVGLLTNPSGVDGKLQATSDILFNTDQISLKALFGPEHGIRGAIYAGEKMLLLLTSRISVCVLIPISTQWLW